MNLHLNKITNKVNKNIDEETELINRISITKYILIYVPLLFLMFAATNFIASLLFDSIDFDWIYILFQAVFFAVFFRIFHGVRKLWNEAWKK